MNIEQISIEYNLLGNVIANESPNENTHIIVVENYSGAFNDIDNIFNNYISAFYPTRESLSLNGGTLKIQYSK